MSINELYPYGKEYDSFLEYRVCCPTCGNVIRYFIPTALGIRIHAMSGDTCHPFIKSIDRERLTPGLGRSEFYPHKMIRLREDMMGGGYYGDLYNLYPMIDGESAEERQARLSEIKLSELAGRMTGAPEKKEWLVRELVKRNECILNALDEITGSYERATEDKWREYDRIIEEVDEKSSAASLLLRFGINTKYSAATVPSEAVCLSVDSPVTSSFSAQSTTTAAVNTAADGTWICPLCGNRSSSRFCTECGSPRPKQ